MRVPAISTLRSPHFSRFLLGSAGGLAVDLGGFSALTALGAAPGVANLISSFASISVVYTLVTRYAFGAEARFRTYALFVAWYSASVLVFSGLVETGTVWTGAPPIAVKLALIPVSFGLNYCFSRRLFGRPAGGDALRPLPQG